MRNSDYYFLFFLLSLLIWGLMFCGVGDSIVRVIIRRFRKKKRQDESIIKENHTILTLHDKESNPLKSTQKNKINDKSNIPCKTISKQESANKLPEAKREINTEQSQALFVNYQLDIPESRDDYAIIRVPHKGCIVRSHRYGRTKRRGFKEESFQNSIQHYFGSNFEISGDVRLNTGKDRRPYEPDIAMIGKGAANIRVDIEIDEPYAGITRQPTHCKGDDEMRDTYFTDRGWIVIRFSEYQVHTQELSCLKYVAEILNAIDADFLIPTKLTPAIDLRPEKAWDNVQAQKWEKELYRERYLNHIFEETTPDAKEAIERDFNNRELSEEKLVKPSVTGKTDKKEAIGFNRINAHPRDNKIEFYPEPHIYTIDNVPAPSVSTIISKFFPEFDAYGKACDLSPGNPLYGNSPEKIVQIWKSRGEEAANLGTYLHEQIEKYYLKQPFEETGEFHLFKQFVKDHSDIEPYRSEWRIFDDDHNMAGTIDLIAKNGNEFDIYDWKRSRKVIDTYSGCPIMTDSWGNRGIGKLSDIHDTSYNRYCLQQSLYRYILEKNYNLRISKMYLIILHPDYDRYYKVEVPYWKERIEYILEAI